MRVNIYAEEMTDRIEIIAKTIEGVRFTGLRFYLELPVTDPNGVQQQGPFIHHPGDDDSSAVTFWGKRDLRVLLRQALAMLDAHYHAEASPKGLPRGWRIAAKLDDWYLFRDAKGETHFGVPAGRDPADIPIADLFDEETRRDSVSKPRSDR